MQTCVITLTKASEKYGNLNIRPCGKDFFPEDAFGSHSRKTGQGVPITLKVEGLPELIKTDIPTDKTGRPRWLLRERAWVKAFLKARRLKAGDTVVVSRNTGRTYSIVGNGHGIGDKGSIRTSVRLEDYGLPRVANDKAVEHTKATWLQKSFLPPSSAANTAEYGTFKDSLNAPVHRWFKYPAGYSYRLVEQKIRQYSLSKRHWILDPFVGSGTTSIEAKRHNINSVGIEAHPFVHWVANTKLDWTASVTDIAENYKKVIEYAQLLFSRKKVEAASLPDLVRKCYSPSNLLTLVAIKNAIRKECTSPVVRDFMNLALTDTLRNASKAATGWPYIAPAKMHQKVAEKPAFNEFGLQVRRMLDDLQFMQSHYSNDGAATHLILGDARVFHPAIRPQSIDLAVTSPPYLNNYDYADRTRLETYFFEWFTTWAEISENVRDKLIVSATTQIRRNSFGLNGGLSSELRTADQSFFNELVGKVSILAERRKQKGGKKSYDCMVAGYFNDMCKVFKQVCRCLTPGCDFVLVLGDSAPYGVYIPTHEYLARLGLAIGFSSYTVEQLRTRGDKWRANPQRHKVRLNEVILTLTK